MTTLRPPSSSRRSGRACPEPGDRGGEILAATGGRGYGVALFLFALPEALPLPVAGLAAVVALPLSLVSLQVALFGTGRPLPGWLRRRSIGRSLFERAVAKAVPVLRRAERISRARWRRLAEADRRLGLACLVLAVVIALPIPFGNILPTLCVTATAFGMIQRDGAVVAAALVAAALTVAGMTAVVLVAGEAVSDLTADLVADAPLFPSGTA